LTARKAEKSAFKRIDLGAKGSNNYIKLTNMQTIKTEKGKRRFSGIRAANETGKAGSSTHRDTTDMLDEYDKERLGASIKTSRSNKGEGSPD
jgi:hypothetical protein